MFSFQFIADYIKAVTLYSTSVEKQGNNFSSKIYSFRFTYKLKAFHKNHVRYFSTEFYKIKLLPKPNHFHV